MKLFLTITLLYSSILLASNTAKDSIAKKEIEKQIQREKKYARERKFYSNQYYDFKSAEVNPESLKNLPDLEDDDMDMDDVYD